LNSLLPAAPKCQLLNSLLAAAPECAVVNSLVGSRETVSACHVPPWCSFLHPRIPIVAFGVRLLGVGFWVWGFGGGFWVVLTGTESVLSHVTGSVLVT
jgi:hypothetical protein